MGNYEQLKQAVSDVIKTNGNKEITGAILQNSLLSIISTIGKNSTFAGIALPTTNPGTPDQNVFYIASKDGIYSNFNQIAINNEVVVLINKSGNWKKVSTGIATKYKLDELEKAIKQIRNTGYVVCSDSEDTQSREVVLDDFTLNKNVRIIIKMNYKAGVNNITLKISETSSLALFYNGKRAGINNTWNDGQLLDVIFDGSSYQSTNFSEEAIYNEYKEYLFPMINNPYYYRYNASLLAGGLTQYNSKRILLPFKNIEKIKSLSVGDGYVFVSWATYKEDLTNVYYKVVNTQKININDIPSEQKTDSKYISFCIKKISEEDISIWDTMGLKIEENVDNRLDWALTSPYRLIEEKREYGYYLSDGSFVSASSRLSISYFIKNGLSKVLVTLKSGGTSGNPQNVIFWDELNEIIWSNPNVSGQELEDKMFEVPQGSVRMTITGDITNEYPVHADALSFQNEGTASLVDDSIIGLEREIILTNEYGINYKNKELISSSNGLVLNTGLNNNVRSSFLRVPLSMKLTTNITFQSGGIAFYSEQRLESFISGIKFNEQQSIDINIPYGAEYFIVCTDTNKEINLECIYAGSMNRTYRKFNLITKLNKPYNWGGSCVWFGSSTTAGITSPNLEKIENCYAKIVSDKLGFTSYLNKAVGGSRICDIESPTSIYNVILNFIEPVDTIFINGGQNDYIKGSPLGNVDDIGTETFCGCYNAIFEYIKNTFPDANVIVIQPQTAKSSSSEIIAPLDAYRELIGQMAVIHGYDTISGDAIFFDTENGAFKEIMQTDGTHPTELGHKYYGEGIASILL